MNQYVRQRLIQVARSNRGYISYSELAVQSGLTLNLSEASERNELSRILGEISAYELSHERPLLSSVAIYKGDNDHGDGFYKLCEELGRGKASVLKQAMFGFEEGSRCQEYWRDEEHYRLYYNGDQPEELTLNEPALFNQEELDFFRLWAKRVYDPENQEHIDAKNYLLNTVWTKTSNLGAAIHERLEGFEIKRGRYWHQPGWDTSGEESRQVAVFKPYTWVRIFRKDDAEKDIFFTVGVDAENDAFVFKLDHFVEKTSKLSQEQKDLFRALVPKNLSWNEIQYDELITLPFGNLVDRMADFILASVETYDMIMDAVWKNIVPQKVPVDTLIRRNPPQGLEELPELNPSFAGGVTDYVAQQKENTELGKAGEELVLKYERDLLMTERPDLAARVEKVLDGKGYDILSFHADGTEKYIEVKTTTAGDNSTFNLTITELIFFRLNVGKAYLYRLYNYDSGKNTALFYVLDGDIENKILTQPVQFRAYKKNSATETIT